MNADTQSSSSSVTEAPEMALPPLLKRILESRGYYTKDAIQKLFRPTLKDLRDPFTLDGMSIAIERLVKAFENKERVAVYADFDLDGTSGLALLVQALEDFGYQNLEYYQPLRLSEGYGLHVAAVEDLKKRGVSVIITVDVGITANIAALKAKELGIDLIITDHHLPKGELPEAYAIVNPNKGTCASQLGHLSGAGVAFYLVLALKRALEQKGYLPLGYNPKKLLDCFVIGTITDLVPLKEENRILVKHGLLQLENTVRPGLRSLIQKLGLNGRALSSADVALGLAPKLNALSRMEMGLMPRQVLMVESVDEAEAMVDQIIQNNELRKFLQKEALVKATEMAELQKDLPFIFVWSKDFHKGIIGLIATQLAKDFSRPAFVGSLDEEGFIHGSSRLPETSAVHLVQVLSQNAEFLVRSGGHQAAAGFVLEEKMAEQFKSGLHATLSSALRTPFTQNFDAVANLRDIDDDFMSWYEKLEPFGKDFPQAILRLENVTILEKSELRGGHLRLSLQQGRKKSQAVYFNPNSRARDMQAGEVIEIFVEPQWNHFRGEKRLQLQIKSII